MCVRSIETSIYKHTAYQEQIQGKAHRSNGKGLAIKLGYKEIRGDVGREKQYGRIIFPPFEI